jgi:hypothetical protein
MWRRGEQSRERERERKRESREEREENTWCVKVVTWRSEIWSFSRNIPQVDHTVVGTAQKLIC